MSNRMHVFSSLAMSPTSSGNDCVYCRVPMHKRREIPYPNRTEVLWYGERWCQMQCLNCGWWTLEFSGILSHEDGISERYGNAFAILQEFDLSGAEIPIGELQRHLLRHYDSRFDIHPRILEEILRSIFANQGFYVELTCYSKDGGIDLFLLRSPANLPVAVQAKRNAATRKIGISEIDCFLGTLVRHGLYHGILVTTSAFTRGAMIAVRELISRGFLIELWDSQRLFDALRCGVVRDSVEVAWETRSTMPIIEEPVGDYGGIDFVKQKPDEKSIRAWTDEIAKRVRLG